RIDIDDERDLAGEVVHHRELFGEQEQEIGNRIDGIAIAPSPPLEPRLDVADDVVAKKSSETTAETRQTLLRRGAVATHEGFDERQRIAVMALEHALPVTDMNVAAGRGDGKLRGQAD